MKTLNFLKTFINIIFASFVLLFILGILGLISLFFFTNYLPPIFQGYGMLFNQNFGWGVYLVPLSYVLGFILFTISIYYLKKCIKPFQESNFYSEVVIKNLRRVGYLFILISTSTVLIRIIAVIYIKTMTNGIVLNFKYSGLQLINSLVSTVEISSIFLLIIGLFFLLFSKAFENAKSLKQENDLTI